MNAAGRYARLRVGAHEVAVAAEVVQEAIQAQASPRPLPRRSGALADACASRHGTVPLLDLAHWLDLGEACTPGQQALVLRSGRRSVAVRISSMHGVGRAAAVSRLHHDEDPQELFQSTVRWEDGGSAALLEVERLMALTQVWCDDAGLAWARPQPADKDSRALPRQSHALLGAGGLRWAVPSRHLREVVPAIPLEFALPPGSHARGICTWRGRKLPVLDLAVLQGGSGRTTGGALVAIVTSGELGAAILVEEALQVAQLAVPEQPAQFQPVTAADGAEALRVDIEQLLGGLAEAEISRGQAASAGSARAGAAASRAAADKAIYLLFEADGTYAAPVSSLVHVVPLDASSAAQLQRGESGRLAFRGQFVPLLPLPAYSGKPPAGSPGVALVVAMHDGHMAAVAVHRVTGWARGDHVQPGAMRAAAFGEFKTVTVAQGGQRSTHMVVELDQVAYMLA